MKIKNNITELLKPRKDKVIIKTKSNAEAKELSKKDIFLSERPAYDIGIWVIATIDPSKTNLNDLLKINGVIDAAYGMEYENVLHYLSNQIFVKLKEELSVSDLDIRSESIELINTFDKIHLITLNIKLDEVLNTCKYLVDFGICEFAEPSFFREMKSLNTHFTDQWGFKNTGQYVGTSGIDIKAEQAWVITRGSPNIKIAIIDEGVDLTHPDLQANIFSG